MKRTIILHNPGAGDEDHLKPDLTAAISEEGFEYEYYSIKSDPTWKSRLPWADLAVVAGGDGTVRRVVRELLTGNPPHKDIPIGLLPMGTANNLSKALGIDSTLTVREHVRHWKNNRQQVFDTGTVITPGQTQGEADFFLESIGYGVFSLLMHRMKDTGISANTPTSDALRAALEVLRELVLSIPTQRYRMEIDGKTLTGSTLLLEIMNIRSIGPNLLLAPEAQTDDGLLDVVCLEEDQRSRFAAYLGQLITGVKAPFGGHLVRHQGRDIRIESESEFYHIDDELIQPAAPSVSVELRRSALSFLV